MCAAPLSRRASSAGSVAACGGARQPLPLQAAHRPLAHLPHTSRHVPRGNALVAAAGAPTCWHQMQQGQQLLLQQQQQQQLQLWRRPRRRHALCCQASGSGGSPEGSDGRNGNNGRGRGSGGGGSSGGGGESLQNFELLVGDCLCLVCFALYKQITAIIFLPSFPGWLAPLAFNPTRFLEFFSFSATLLGTWVASGLLTGGYKFAATANLQTSLSRTCLMWLIAMPVAAAQLVLVTAAEDVALVGDEGFASALPLAATGPGEPFVTAAGVLGLMAVWRAFYAAFLDIYSFGKMEANRRNRQRDMEHFADSLRGAMLLSLACCAVLQLLGGLVGEEELELMASSLLGSAFASGGGVL